MPEYEIKAQTVEALLETTRELLRAEDARSESFVARGGAVGGFAGIIASLAGGLGAQAISEDLGKLRWVADLSLAFGLAGLSRAFASRSSGFSGLEPSTRSRPLKSRAIRRTRTSVRSGRWSRARPFEAWSCRSVNFGLETTLGHGGCSGRTWPSWLGLCSWWRVPLH